MTRPRASMAGQPAQKSALKRRIRALYQKYNQEDRERCYQFLDPRLREKTGVEFARYADSLGDFKRQYGQVRIWHLDVNLYLDARANRHDERPFAYGYVFWRDDHQAFHVFRERWVLDLGRWYTRVVGLVTHDGSDGRQG